MFRKINVAIIGAGTGGALLARSLSQLKTVDYEIFEREDEEEFGGLDAEIELGTSAWLALNAMGLDPDRMLSNAGATERDASRCLVANGDHKGEVLVDPSSRKCVVLKSRWHQELLKTIPKEKLHFKELVSVSEGTDKRCELHFQDKSRYKADIVIGCDGLNSTVRKLILEEDYPELVEPRFGGYWNLFARITSEKAAECFGSDFFPFEGNELALTGKGTAILFRESTDDPEQYEASMSGIIDPELHVDNDELNTELLHKMYENSDPDFVEAMDACLSNDAADPSIFFQWESQEAPTYTRGNLCMMGNAAHKILPWIGSIGDLEIEDAAVMTSLLGSMRSRRDISAALLAFDQTRRKRLESIQEQTHVAAKIMTGQLGLDPGKVAELQPEKWATIEEDSLDVEAHIREALSQFRSLRGNQATESIWDRWSIAVSQLA